MQIVDAVADEVTISAEPGRIRGYEEAVRRGVASALQTLRRTETLGPVEVRITEFVGLVTDTNDHDAETASFLATLSAFLEPSAMPTPHLSEEGRWHLRSPAPSTSR
jgi:hypothetical protein